MTESREPIPDQIRRFIDDIKSRCGRPVESKRPTFFVSTARYEDAVAWSKTLYFDHGLDIDVVDAIKPNDKGDLMESLAEIIRPELLPVWMASPNEAFGGRSPSSITRDGDEWLLWEMVWQIESNVAN